MEQDERRHVKKHPNSTINIDSKIGNLTSKTNTFLRATRKFTNCALPALPSLLFNINPVGNVIPKFIRPMYCNAPRMPTWVMRVLMIGARTNPPKPQPERTMPNARPRWALKWSGVSVMTGK